MIKPDLQIKVKPLIKKMEKIFKEKKCTPKRLPKQPEKEFFKNYSFTLKLLRQLKLLLLSHSKCEGICLQRRSCMNSNACLLIVS